MNAQHLQTQRNQMALMQKINTEHDKTNSLVSDVRDDLTGVGNQVSDVYDSVTGVGKEMGTRLGKIEHSIIQLLESLKHANDDKRRHSHGLGQQNRGHSQQTRGLGQQNRGNRGLGQQDEDLSHFFLDPTDLDRLDNLDSLDQLFS